MNIFDILEETFIALSSNKIRTGLTMLGIIIGIASVIAMVSIGTGAKKTIEDSIQSIGSNLIMVSPGTQRGLGQQVSSGRGSATTLTLDDSEAVGEKISGVKAVAPNTSSRYQIVAKGTNTNTSVMGVTSTYTEVKNVSVENGVFISDQHNSSRSKVAVLGPDTMTDLFGEDFDAIGQTIKINGLQFKVIGVTTAKGGSGFSNVDDVVYVPITTAQTYFTGDDKVGTINVQAESTEVMSQVQSDITSLLLERHNISDPALADFSTMNQSDIVNSASSITDTLTLLLGSVAGISLIVGGIGIMNMMLTTVTERTREIGLRKAIGAKKKDISMQFLIEAITLTFVGGVIGVFLGWIIAFSVTKLGIIQTDVTMSSILLAFGVSAIIGIVFGYYPARRASKLNPIEALRYE